MSTARPLSTYKSEHTRQSRSSLAKKNLSGIAKGLLFNQEYRKFRKLPTGFEDQD